MQSITLVSLTVLSDSTANQNSASRPTLCRNCGAIVGAGAAQCAVCGTSTAQSAATQPTVGADSETVRFARAVLNRPYKFTILLLVANLFLFLLMWDSNRMNSISSGFSFNVLIVYGAKLNYLINGPYHQWWRFVTPMFLHVNLLHLLVNMYSLWMIGPYVEKLYGSAKFTVFWVVTGIAGVVASYLTVVPSLATNPLSRFIFKADDSPSAGASGALFGLIGVLFVFGIKFRHELPEGFKRAFGTGMLPIILINLLIGFAGSSFIDNAAHLGGLVMGAAMASVVHYHRPGERAGVAITWRVLQVLVLAVVLLSFYKVARNFRNPIPPPPQLISLGVNTQEQILVNYFSAMTKGQESATMMIQDGDISSLDATAQALMSASLPDEQAKELRDRLVSILAKMAEGISKTQNTDGPRRTPQLDETLLQEYAKWQKDYETWLATARNESTTP